MTIITIKRPKINCFVLSTTLNLKGRMERRQRLHIIRTREIPNYSLSQTPFFKSIAVVSPNIDKPRLPIIVFLSLQLAFLFGLISWIFKKIADFLEYFLN